MEINPQHILCGRQPYGKGFLEQVPYLLERLSAELDLKARVNDFSVESIQIVDAAIDKVGVQRCLEPLCFCSLIAFAGTVLLTHVKSNWMMREDESGIWEPWVVSEQDSRAPFVSVFHRLDPDEDRCPLEWALDTDILILRGGAFKGGA
jgi:hypothetical protein